VAEPRGLVPSAWQQLVGVRGHRDGPLPRDVHQQLAQVHVRRAQGDVRTFVVLDDRWLSLIKVKQERREKVKAIVEANQNREVPAWVERNSDAMRFQMLGLPNVEQMGLDISANLIVEFYSR